MRFLCDQLPCSILITINICLFRNVKLLSFVGDEDEAEEEEMTDFKKKPIYRPERTWGNYSSLQFPRWLTVETSFGQSEKDSPNTRLCLPTCIKQPTSQSITAAGNVRGVDEGKFKRHSHTFSLILVIASRRRNQRRKKTKILPKSGNNTPENKLRPSLYSIHYAPPSPRSYHVLACRSSRKAEIAKMESEIRKLQKRRDGDDSDDSDAAAQRAKKAKRSYLSEELAKYSKGRGLHKKGKKRDEGDVLAALNSFRGKLQSSMLVDEEPEKEDVAANENGDDKPEPGAGGEGAGMEVDDDTGFMGHALHFAKDDAEDTKAERDYEVIDPRVRSAKAKEEERERKKAALKAKGGVVSGGRFRRQ